MSRSDQWDVTAAVDFSTQFQEWHGFGVNYVQAARTPDYKTNPQDYGGFSFLEEAQRREIIELIFGEAGLKPALVKMFLDPLHQPKVGGSFDHESSTGWMRYFVRQGLEETRRRGDSLTVLTTLYGPPAWATRQGQLNSRDPDPDKFRALCSYLADWVTWLKEREGFPVHYLSLHNEGDKPHNWPADGIIQAEDIFDYNTFWPPALLAEFIGILRHDLNRRGLHEIGITPGECSSWAHFHERLYDWNLAANLEALQSLALITCHSFGAGNTITPAGVQYLRRFRPELPAWVSSASWGNQDLHLAEHISRNINQVRVNGYIAWACVQTPSQWKDGMDPNAAPPIRVNEDGSYEVLSAYSLYKQFTRAGRPGMSVALATTTADSGVDLIAFSSNKSANPDAFIVINFNDWQAKAIGVRVTGTASKRFRAFRTWRRYKFRTMETYQDLGTFKVQGGVMEYSAPVHSVTTFFAE